MAGTPDPESYPQALEAVSAHGDATEVGIPYSDPLMDGPVVADAGERAIRAGVGPLQALELASDADVGLRAAMTYYNPIHQLGEGEFCERAARAGMDGLNVPALPLEPSGR